MRFEVRHPTGAVHEIELSGSIAVMGRDPSCDLVLNDSKCSRRHAVIEAGPDGLTVRDSGSANGIFVNGRRVERQRVIPGDEIRLGEVVVRVLEDEIAGTLVMGPDEILELAPGPAKITPTSTLLPLPATPPPSLPAPAPPARVAPRSPQPVAPRPEARPPVRGGEELPRPLTPMTLAALWLLSGIGYLAAAAAIAWHARQALSSAAVPLLLSLTMALTALVLGVGLWLRAPWARILQMAAAGIGLLSCVFAPISAVALAYMLRPVSAIHFSGRRTYRQLTADEALLVRAGAGEGAFTAGVLASLLVSWLLAGAAAVSLPILMKP